MEQQGKKWIKLAGIAITSVITGQEDDKDGRKKVKMRKKKAEKINSLSKTEHLLMEHQGKTMDITSQYRHYSCNRPKGR